MIEWIHKGGGGVSLSPVSFGSVEHSIDACVKYQSMHCSESYSSEWNLCLTVVANVLSCASLLSVMLNYI